MIWKEKTIALTIVYMIIYNISLNYMYSVVKLKRNRKQYKEEIR